MITPERNVRQAPTLTLQQLREGEEKFVNPVREALCRLVGRIGLEDAEDMVQEVLTDFLVDPKINNEKRFADKSIFPYLRGMLFKKYKDRYRIKSQLQWVTNKPLSEEMATSQGRVSEPERIVTGNIFSLQIHERFFTLLPIDKEILTLRYMEGLTCEQMAPRLGITKMAAERRLDKAKQRARRHFKSFYDKGENTATS